MPAARSTRQAIRLQAIDFHETSTEALARVRDLGAAARRAGATLRQCPPYRIPAFADNWRLGWLNEHRERKEWLRPNPNTTEAL